MIKVLDVVCIISLSKSSIMKNVVVNRWNTA